MALREGDLITIEQALRLLPVSKSLFHQILADGAVPHIRISASGSRRGRVLVERAGLEAYVAALRQPAPARTVKVDVDSLREKVRNRAPAAHANQVDVPRRRR